MGSFSRLSACTFAFTLLCSTPVLAQEKAEVMHWWTSAGESAAVKVFADAYTKAGGTWVDNAIAGGVNARAATVNRMVGGNPPTMAQFNTGKQFDELIENGLLVDVEAIAQAGKWRELMPKPIIEATVRDGKFYAVPVNIHGQNWMFYNTKIFADAGLEPPKTFPELIETGEKLKAKGVIPIALGGQPTWERNLFSALLVGHGGADLFRKIYGARDVEAAKSDKFKEVAELYGKMRGLVDPGSPGRNWNDAASLVITGKAAMHFNGDWAKGEFIAAGQTAGKEYGCTIVGEGKLVIGGDVFVFPVTKDAGAQAAQQKLAAVLLDPETQLAFNKKKGSIPVRLDVDVSSMDACAQKSHAVLKDPANQVEATEIISTPNFTGAMQDAITQYWNTSSMSADAFVEKVVTAMRSAS
ncbi:carbohydrate ABC transporter substrate-binding protein [Chelatococcus daeguensis]|uniref:Probable sugar-binding periplasmic protein n=1 Tax=Chelatococcus daeguensis TaxID=444444 RepID=A0AAC9NZ11_9HYPH|nr:MULTISPECIES: ABC transporter substrate-binding protein [Chelatococcus]APF37550.1 sugar ABC transporter substrate-binding protein [Chelatococcus daeguensis]KZE35484.1 sugar ABC transporter substrate-binding protein [Chelatococcus daeguensis]MBM3085482.1 carbohydrate ABC transporter substrate-binding protein [Chelatococcus daeguensis]